MLVGTRLPSGDAWLRFHPFSWRMSFQRSREKDPTEQIQGRRYGMSANGKIGVAVQGSGLVSSGHLNAYLKNPHCELVAIGGRTKSGAAAKAREVGIDPASIGI